ncbi:MAG: hypothetical protein RJQ09_02170 [Cyclobacteriaceae bacterium]
MKLYVDNGKKITLGITGATLSDMLSFNPESIHLINQYQSIFEIILRPYAHDISLIRSDAGFEMNIETGFKLIKQTFKSFTPYYLPPEFMITGSQLSKLSSYGVEGVFINANRYNEEIKKRLPDVPYEINGTLKTNINCIPINSGVTKAYLDSVHHYRSNRWNKLIDENRAITFSWRDGESTFFIPDGNEREGQWLIAESEDIERRFLKEISSEIGFLPSGELAPSHYKFYPVHSFLAWMQEFRALGFINKVDRIEQELLELSIEQKALWLQIISSDILSAIEKSSPEISIKTSPGIQDAQSFTIWRSERGFEGEELLELLKLSWHEAMALLNDYSGFGKKIMSRVESLKSILD